MKSIKIRLSKKQLDAVITSLSEWAFVEQNTVSGKSLARYLRTVKDSIQKQIQRDARKKIVQ